MSSCRRPVEVFNLTARLTDGSLLGTAFPDLRRIGSIQIPYACAIVGYFGNIAVEGSGVGQQGAYVIVGQLPQEILLSNNTKLLASFAAFQRSALRESISDAVFFKGSGYPVAANEPISLYVCGSIFPFIAGTISFFVVPQV